MTLSRAPRASAAPLALVGLISLLGACSSGDGKGNNSASAMDRYGLSDEQLTSITAIDTALTPPTIAAGSKAQVSCLGQPGNIVIPKPAFAVVPDEAVTIDGAQVIAEKVGSYEIACTLEKSTGDLADPTPAELQVIAGPAVETTAVVQPASIASGATAQVTCTGKDAFGNEIPATDDRWSVAVSPAETADIEGLTLTGKIAGTADVLCKHEGADDATANAAQLEVTAGAPTKTVATVEPSTSTAGDTAKVTCKATDDAGNDASAAGAFTVSSDGDVTVNGMDVTSTVAGEHEVRCAVSGAAELEQEAAVWTVEPGPLVDFKLTTKPAKPFFKKNENMQLIGVGIDEFGNEFEGVELADGAATVAPEDGVKVNVGSKATSYVFEVDGVYTFTHSMKDDPGLSDTIEVTCDSVGPVVDFISPTRGETRDGAGTFPANGTITDATSDIGVFKVNGQDIGWNEDSTFGFEITADYGMNALIWEAEDIWGNVSTGVQTFYYSTKYYDVGSEDPAIAQVGDGLGVWLSQIILDKKVVDGKPHDHSKPVDIATLIELVVGSLDVNTLLGGGQPIPLGPVNGNVELKKLKLGDPAINNGYPEVELKVVKDGLNMKVTLNKFSAELNYGVSFDVLGQPLGYDDTTELTADKISVEMLLIPTVDQATGELKVQIADSNVELVNLAVNTTGLVGFLTDWLINLVLPAVNGVLESAIELALENLIPGLLEDVFKQLALNLELPLDPFIGEGDPVTLELSTGFSDIQFIPTVAQEGGMIIKLNAGVTAENKVPHEVLGSWGRDACGLGSPEIFTPSLKFPMEIGLYDDFANQLLHALWRGGFLQLELGQEVIGDSLPAGITDLSVKTDFLLPPILNTCAPSDKGVKLQVGDVKVDAALKFGGTPIEVTLYATVQADASITAMTNAETGEKELGIALNDIDMLELEIISINEEAEPLKDVLLGLVQGTLVPQLLDGLGDGLGSFPIPEIDLSSLSDAIPAGTALAISIEQIDMESGYTYIRGGLK